MRKIFAFSFLIILLLGAVPASMQGQDEAAIRAVLRQAGIDRPVQLSQWGSTAACFAEKDSRKTLCVLEREKGTWHLTIANSGALRQDRDYPSLLLDSDMALFWSYQMDGLDILFDCFKENDGKWGAVGAIITETLSSGKEHGYTVRWRADHGGEIVYQAGHRDAEGRFFEEEPHYLPAQWLKGSMTLDSFSIERFPAPEAIMGYDARRTEETFFRDAAAYMMPEYTYIRGMLKDHGMHFLMQKRSGEKVYVLCDYGARKHAIQLIESTPLPEDAVLGVDNFSDCLGWGKDRLISIRKCPRSSRCALRISLGGPEAIQFGENCAFTDEKLVYIGTHPWAEISRMDWSTIPNTLAEAAERMDAGSPNARYAAVNNPKPAERLHLREKADKKSRSFGKYYNGTPVKVHALKGEWAQVEIGNQRGWMMKKYLAMGKAGKALLCDMSAMPNLFIRGNSVKLYTSTKDSVCDTILYWEEGMKIVGIIEDGWYHVWLPLTNEYYFVRQSDLWEGNG